MKPIHLVTVLSFLVLMEDVTQAGLLEFRGGRKGCECAESCQPLSCKPSIARPCHMTLFSHQRKCSNVKPSCGESGCTAVSCCAPTSSCGVAVSCPPIVAGCMTEGCSDSCGGAEGCCAEDCREIAKLIQESKTGCYATHRRDAIHRLGDRYDCVCYPQVMNAFIYALNDSDERVRSKSADEIGDQIRRNRCICGSPVIQALQRALADCDRSVRRQAEEALKLSGYRIVDGVCCTTHNEPQVFTASVTAVWSGATPDAPPSESTVEDVPVLAPVAAAENVPFSTVQPEASEAVLPPISGDSEPELAPSPSDAGYDADPAEGGVKATTEKPQAWFPSQQRRNVLSRLLGQRS